MSLGTSAVTRIEACSSLHNWECNGRAKSFLRARDLALRLADATAGKLSTSEQRAGLSGAYVAGLRDPRLGSSFYMRARFFARLQDTIFSSAVAAKTRALA